MFDRRFYDAFFDNSVSSLLVCHEEHLYQLPYSIVSIYQTVITEHLPRILDSIDTSRIVSESINEMDMDETEKMIFQVMDKELKAIVRSGVALCTIMGCVNLLIR